MKKIGIISMQRIKNYGSFWQAFGLKKVINENIDGKVEFVDYFPGNSVVCNIKSNVDKESNKIKILSRKIYGTFFHVMYKYIWLPRYLGVMPRKNYSKKYDCTIIGSDEVFNCTQPGNKVGFSEDLFGAKRKNVITYAASFGYTTLSRLEKYNISESVKMLLKRIRCFSVRDENSYEIIYNLTKRKANINLDPVLISDVNKMELPKINLKDYIVVYAYSGRITSIEKEKIISFAKKNNKKIISMGYYHDFVDKIVVCDPFKTLAYIKNADYVITDTFHGSIFSIIFQKQFITLIRESNKEKVGDLLKRLKLEHRCLHSVNDLETRIDEEIDYKETFDIIEKEKEKAIDYLINSICEE